MTHSVHEIRTKYIRTAYHLSKIRFNDISAQFSPSTLNQFALSAYIIFRMTRTRQGVTTGYFDEPCHCCRTFSIALFFSFLSPKKFRFLLGNKTAASCANDYSFIYAFAHFISFFFSPNFCYAWKYLLIFIQANRSVGKK